MNVALQRLRAEIRFDRNAFAARIEELDGLRLSPDPSGSDQRARAAVALHHAYGAIESIMSRVSRVLEGDTPSGADWHRELLQSMGLSIAGVRHPVFSAGTIAVPRHLLGFRHFFRHAYAVDNAPAVLAELDDLAVFLAKVAEKD